MLDSQPHSDPARVSAGRSFERSMLSQIALFADLTAPELAQVEQLCRYRRFTADEHVFDRDSTSTDVYFLVRGRVRVVNYSMSGREITFDELDAGGYFGELAALDGRPRSANVVALEDSLILSLPRTAFIDLLAANHQLALKVMCRLAGLVRSANERIMDLSTLAAQNRVQAEILRQAHMEGSRPNSAVIEPIPVHSAIASRVSTTRETVARVMNDLARKGVLERRKRTLVIHDVRKLRQMVEHVRG